MYQVLVDLHMHQTAVCIKLNIQTKHKYYTILVEIDTLVEIDALVVYSTICGPAYILYVCPASMTIRLFHIPGFQVLRLLQVVNTVVQNQVQTVEVVKHKVDFISYSCE